MGFGDLFKPKYKHSNPDVRKEAITKLDDLKLLGEIVRNENNEEVKEVALNKMDEIYISIVESRAPEKEQRDAIRKIRNEDYLIKVVKSYDESPLSSRYTKWVCIGALGNSNLTDESLLCKMAENDDSFIRMGCLFNDNLKDPYALCYIGKHARDFRDANDALRKLERLGYKDKPCYDSVLRNAQRLHG